MVAINCNRRREVGFAFLLLMFVLQALVLFSYDTPRITKWTSLGVAALLGPRARGFGCGMLDGVNGPPMLDVVSGAAGWFCSEFTCAVCKAS